jgi:hypothetical protein
MNKFNGRFLMKNISLFGIFIFIISGCSTISAPLLKLDVGAERVVVAKSVPDDNYKVIGPVSGIDGVSCGGFGYRGTYERAITNLRNKTYVMGGDYVQIIKLTEPYSATNCYVNEFSIRGTAYKKIAINPNPLAIIDVGEESLTKKLRELSLLNKEGILTNEEYQQQKNKLLKKGFN